MKKNLLSLFVVLGTGILSFAQTNSGFENWSQNPTLQQPEEPTGWVTANVLASPLVTFPNPNPNPTSAFKAGTPNNYQGTYSLDLNTIQLIVNPDSTVFPNIVGAAFLGSIQVGASVTVYDREAYTGRPANISFAAKYAPNGVDTAWCLVEITKWNTGTNSRDTIAELSIPIAPNANYQTYNVPLTYYSTTTFPDSLRILFSSSGFFSPKVGSQLHADAIGLYGSNSVEDVYSLSSLVSVFPNPATDAIAITTNIDNAKNVILYDAIGKTIGKYELQNKEVKVNTSFFPIGSYFYSILDEDGKVLTGGDFNVTR